MKPEYFIRSAAALSLLLGVIVLFGWYSHQPALVQILPQFVAMQYNTALGFVLCGAGLLALDTGRGRIALAAGGSAALIGLLTGAQYVFGISLGIDQLMMEHYITIGASHPGRMAPNTALCFSLSGFILALGAVYTGQYRVGIMRMIAAMISVLGFIALMGYIVGVEAGYGWASLTRMAVHTSSGFILLGSALFVYTWRIDHAESGDRLILWAGGVLAIAAFYLSVALSAEIRKQDAELIQTKLTNETAFFSTVLENAVRARADALSRLAERMAEVTQVDASAVEALSNTDAERYLRDFEELVSLTYFAKDWSQVWVEPQHASATSESVSLTVKNIPYTADERFHLTGKILTADDRPVFIVSAPLEEDSPLSGTIVGVYDINIFLTAAAPLSFFKDYGFSITNKDMTLYSHAAATPEFTQAWAYDSKMSIGGADWSLKVWPAPAYIAQEKSTLSAITIIGGALSAGLIMIAALFVHSVRQHSKTASEGEHRLRKILDTVSDGIIIANPQGKIVRYNPAAERMFGHLANEMLGQPVSQLFPAEHRSGQAAGYSNLIYLAKNKTVNTEVMELEALHKDGDVFPIELGLRSIEIDGEPFVIASTRDITERKKTERQIQSNMSELARKNKELDSFAYVASHDLKSPLRAVSNLSTMIEEDLEERLDDDSRRNFGLIRGRIARLNKMLDDLLDYARVGNADMEDNELISGRVLVDDISNIVLAPEAFTIDAGPEFDNISVNRMPLQQVLYNLIKNAVKHHDKPSGAIMLSVSAQNGWLEFTVADDGPGIAEDHQEKIFQIFQTLKTRDKVEGSGIGLSVVKKNIESVGGEIRVNSAPGEGTKFIFTWPENLSASLAKHRNDGKGVFAA